LSNNEGAFKQTLIGYITAATDDDRMFDGESFDANDYVDFIVFAKIRSLLSKAKHCHLIHLTPYN
jgi:hypothetical protein